MCAALIAAAASFPSAASVNKEGEGHLVAGFAGGSLKAAFEEIPAVRGSLLQVFTSTGSGGYSSNADPPEVTRQEMPGGGYVLTARFGRATGGRFTATESVEVHPHGMLILRLDALWNGDQPAYCEWAAAMLWAYPLFDAEWQAVLPGGALLAGRIGEVPQSNPPLGQILAQGFERFNIHGRAFDLSIAAGSGFPEVLVLDGRSNTAPWAQQDRLFWVGSIHTQLQPGASVHRSLTLQFSRGNAAPAAGPALYVQSGCNALPGAPAATTPPLLIPQPKEVQFTGTEFRVAEGCTVAVAARDARLGRAAREALRGLAGLRFRGSTWSGKGILIVDAGDLPAHPQIQAAVLQRGWAPPNRAEGYRLHVDEGAAVVVGSDAAGAFYGLQTLRQLVQMRGSGAAIAGCEIRDWPSLPFRGAHLFTGVRALPFHKKLVERILSRFKMNSLVLECEYTRWDTHPEIAADFAMGKKDLAADVAFARDHFLQPIPLVQSLGHSQWVFHNGKHLDLAEDRNHPSDLCPNNPGTYRLVLDVYAEALQLFHPAYFHIGHDEVGIFGRFPAHPWCAAQGSDAADAASNLFASDVAKLAGWLRSHGVRTILWGDMLLNRSEIFDAAANAPTADAAAKRRAALPKDAVIADWHYDAIPAQKYPSLGIFHREAGVPVIASTWYDPGNIFGFAHAAIQQGAMGLLQTTWAGFNSQIGVLKQEFQQFTAFVLASEYAWSGNPLQPDKLPYRPEEVFKDAWENELLPPERRQWAVDLHPAVNDGESRLSGIPAGVHWCRRRAFQLAERHGAIGVIRLAGKLDRPDRSWPREVVLKVHATSQEIDFVHACSFPSASPVAAEYRIVYADGRSVKIPIAYGDAIAALDDLRPSWGSDIACRAAGAGGQPLALRLFRWKNPRPHEPITEIHLKAVDAVASPMIAAITCVK